MTNKLTVVQVQGTKLENYGERDMIRELVSRMMAFHPAAQEVGEKGMMMAAQLAILMNASPLPGVNEIHIFKDNKGNVKVEPGINYWMRRADQKGGVFWVIQPRLMTEEEMEMYQIPKGIIGAICCGCRKAEMFDMLRSGFTKKEVVDGISITGIGTTTTGDYAKNGRPLSWSAIKRCRTDFYKQAVPYVPGEMLPPAEGLARDELGQVIPNMHRLNYEAMEPIEYGELTDDEADDLNDALFGGEPTTIHSRAVVYEFGDDEPEVTAVEPEPEPESLPSYVNSDPASVSQAANAERTTVTEYDGFRAGDAVMVQGKHDEKEGVVTGFDGELVQVNVDGKALNVKADRVRLVDALLDEEE